MATEVTKRYALHVRLEEITETATTDPRGNYNIPTVTKEVKDVFTQTLANVDSDKMRTAAIQSIDLAFDTI